MSESAVSHPDRPPQGRLFVVSAPSGAGKTTLCNALRRHFPDLAYSISYTTRQPRNGEQHGKDYYFITPREFEAGIDQGLWAEWARVHGNLYGTSAQGITDLLSSGRDVLLDIDVQGACQILKRFPDAVTIFIRPPSLDELRRRLIARGTDAAGAIERRLANAADEMARQHLYKHILVNDDLEKATRDLINLFDAYRSRRR
jgi:guanylate kinase